MPQDVQIRYLPVGDLSPQECSELPHQEYWALVKSAVDDEITAMGGVITDLKEELLETVDVWGSNPLTSKETDDDHVSCFLDWASIIRKATGYDWATCLNVAGVFYYG